LRHVTVRRVAATPGLDQVQVTSSSLPTWARDVSRVGEPETAGKSDGVPADGPAGPRPGGDRDRRTDSDSETGVTETEPEGAAAWRVIVTVAFTGPGT
jgi:hypothetical protein